MTDIYSMTERQIVIGLMRGNRSDFQQGYGPQAAVASAARIKNLDMNEQSKLLAYAEGWLDGLAEADSAEQYQTVERKSEAVT